MRKFLSPRPPSLSIRATKPASPLLGNISLLPHIRFDDHRRHLAQVRPDREIFSELWFTPSRACGRPSEDLNDQPHAYSPDERTLKLGNSEFLLLYDHGTL